MGVVVIASTRHRSRSDVLVAAVLVVHAAVRTLLPLTWTGRWRSLLSTAGDAALCAAAIGVSGNWNSAFVLTLVTCVVAVGVGGGFAFAVPLALLLAVVVTVSSLSHPGGLIRVATAGTTELVLAALVAAYGRQLFGEAERRASTVLDRLSGLAETNDLLQALNAVAQALPASLNLHETTAEILGQLRTLFGGEASAILLWDASLGQWSVAGAEGVRLPATLGEDELAAPLRTCSRQLTAANSAMLVDLGADGPGMTPAARRGLYAPLVARNSLVGVVGVETASETLLTPRDVELMNGLAEQAALAIDNALWFARLRTLGAEQERNRIARDLHDRVAQSLAYVAFELERIVDLSRVQAVTDELDGLRNDVRRVVSEVRDTLYDLRTDVSDSRDLQHTMEDFLDRVRRRSGLDVTFSTAAIRRLAMPLERELWRIGQEAVVNVERHARASRLDVTWTVDHACAELSIADDGCGFPLGSAGRFDSYGLLGMRERADAIGATLTVDTAPGSGTTIRCHLEVL